MTYLEPNGPSATGLYMPIRMHWNLSLLKCFPPTVGYNTDKKINCIRANAIDADLISSSIHYGVWTHPTNPYQLIVQAMQNDNAYVATNLKFCLALSTAIL